MDIQHAVVLCFLGTLCLQISQQTPTRCILGPVTGMCKAYMPRFFFNDTSKACEGFIYGGCGGNDNNFETQEECETACILDGVDPCSLEPDTGMCRASIPRFFYNRTSGTCNQFIYGGCGGNDNNFETVEECEGQCKVAATVDPCFLKPETGMCRASIPRYFYNHTSGSCEMFTYGGCKGNENNFETVQACADKCVPSISQYFQIPEHQSFYHCFLKPEIGPCHAMLPRYFYNTTLAGCQAFFYGGCQGNANNFEELKECTDSCTGADHCLLQPDKGTCLATLPRHFYNATSNKCELFFYGGCGGNDNNFATPELCEAECARDGGNNYASCLRSPGPILLLSFIISVLLTIVL